MIDKKEKKDEEIQESEEKVRPSQQVKREIVTTTIPKPPKKKETFISTHQLDAEGKIIGEQRYWDQERTLRKPTLVTSDIPNPEDVAEKKKRDEIMAERKAKMEEK